MNIMRKKSKIAIITGGIIISTAISTQLAKPIGLNNASNNPITNSPKEIIDQVWQMVYRDYLDSNGKYKLDVY